MVELDVAVHMHVELLIDGSVGWYELVILGELVVLVRLWSYMAMSFGNVAVVFELVVLVRFIVLAEVVVFLMAHIGCVAENVKLLGMFYSALPCWLALNQLHKLH